MVKHIKIQPAPRSTPLLPFGLSAATGIVLTTLMFSSHLISLTPLGALLGSPLHSETKVMKEGELPVDVLEISEITFLAGEQGNGDSGAQNPNPQNAFAPPLAPLSKGTWTRKTDMPTARGMLATSAADRKIYAIGGIKIFPAGISTVEEYDPVTDTWKKKADMPTARNHLSASAVNGKIYVIGGWNWGVVSAVEEYDSVADKWTKKANMPMARNGLSTCVVNGKIYAIAGWIPFDAIPNVDEYDPVTDKWTKKADIPTARWGLATSAVNGKIYAIGGRTGIGGQAPAFFSTVEEYDPTTDTWTRKADMPTARWGLATSVVNGKIYAIGGTQHEGVTLLSTVEEYDPVTDTWTKRADMPTARQYLSTSVVKGKIYVIGGSVGGQYLSTVEEYDTGFTGQSIDTEGKLPTTWGRMKGGK